MDQLVPHSRDIFSWTYEPYNGGTKFQNGDTIMARIIQSQRRFLFFFSMVYFPKYILRIISDMMYVYLLCT